MSSTNSPPGGFMPASSRTRFAISWSVQAVSPLIPTPPTTWLPAYSATPPPKVMMPPAICPLPPPAPLGGARSEEHTSELQSPCNLVCRLLLEKKKTTRQRERLRNSPSDEGEWAHKQRDQQASVVHGLKGHYLLDQLTHMLDVLNRYLEASCLS